jgi:AcrR family transcriptional regulator
VLAFVFVATQPKRPQKTPRGEARRKAILQAAIPLLADNGYRGASLASIAAAADLTQQGVLHYFRSKEELLLALIQERDRQDGKRLSALVTEEGLALLDVLEELVRHNQESREDVRLFSTLVAEGASVEHPAHDYFVERYQRIRGRVLRSLREGQEVGEIDPDVDLNALVPAIVGAMDGLQIQWLLDPEIDMSAGFEALMRLLRAQLRMRPEDGVDQST